MAWTHINMIYMATPKVSHVALCVLHVLAKAADVNTHDCYPSIPYIAEKIGLSTRSVKRGLQELYEAGLVIWKSGRGNRHVNTYHLNVDNFGQTGHTVTFDKNKRDTQSPLECQTGQTVTLKVTHSHLKGDTQSHGSIENKTTSKLVSKCPTQGSLFQAIVDNSTKAEQCPSAEGVPPKQDKGVRQEAPSAPAMMEKQVDYNAAIKTYGWKPKNRKDIEAVVTWIYRLGVSMDEAKAFARFNNIRKWDAINSLVSVHQLAKEWLKVWKEKSPGDWDYEQKQRSEMKRRREEEILRAQLEKERKDDNK